MSSYVIFFSCGNLIFLSLYLTWQVNVRYTDYKSVYQFFMQRSIIWHEIWHSHSRGRFLNLLKCILKSSFRGNSFEKKEILLYVTYFHYFCWLISDYSKTRLLLTKSAPIDPIKMYLDAYDMQMFSKRIIR